MNTYELFLSFVEDLGRFGLSSDQAASEVLPYFSEEEQKEIVRACEEDRKGYELYINSFHMPAAPVDIRL